MALGRAKEGRVTTRGALAEGRISEGGFARQWFIKKHLFKGSPLPDPTANSTATFVSLGYINGWNVRGEGGRLALGCGAEDAVESTLWQSVVSS